MSKITKDTNKTVGQDDVIRALAIREGGGTWLQVIEATGFNGATLRPHIAKHLASKERLGRPPVNKGDRVDSPYAHVEPVELTQDSIIAARKRGMAWYSIAQALGQSEAKVKGLAGPEAAARVYRKAVKPADKPPVVLSDSEKAEAKRVERNLKAKARREAKKAEKAAK